MSQQKASGKTRKQYKASDLNRNFVSKDCDIIFNYYWTNGAPGMLCYDYFGNVCRVVRMGYSSDPWHDNQYVRRPMKRKGAYRRNGFKLPNGDIISEIYLYVDGGRSCWWGCVRPKHLVDAGIIGLACHDVSGCSWCGEGFIGKDTHTFTPDNVSSGYHISYFRDNGWGESFAIMDFDKRGACNLISDDEYIDLFGTGENEYVAAINALSSEAVTLKSRREKIRETIEHELSMFKGCVRFEEDPDVIKVIRLFDVEKN